MRYEIRLKRISPVQGKVQLESRLAEFYVDSNKILSVRIYLPEFEEFLMSLPDGEEFKEGKFTTEDSYVFFKAIIYAVGRWSMRKYDESKIYHLQEAVRGLPYYDAKYWFNVIRMYSHYGDSKLDLLRPAKAFRLVAGLD